MKVKILYTLEAASGVIVGSTSQVLRIGIDKGALRGRWVAFDSQTGKLGVADLGPVIPGSSVKGKVRDNCERILRSIARHRPVCESPYAARMCAPGEQPCDICAFFGGPAIASRLFFADAACQLPEDARRFSTKVQTGVSLSRKRRVAEDERLFFQDRAVEDISYAGAIDGHLDSSMADRQIALLIVGLERLVAVGGGKSRGCGSSRITVYEVRKDTEVITGQQIQTIREALAQWKQYK
jgi:CRISPR/Cas system CSM-associated protein Csm3 (group 7 of RAMP superfamily)